MYCVYVGVGVLVLCEGSSSRLGCRRHPCVHGLWLLLVGCRLLVGRRVCREVGQRSLSIATPTVFTHSAEVHCD